MPQTSDALQFKFRYVGGGQAKGLFAKKAEITPAGMKLGDDTVPYEAVADTTSRDNRLVLVLSPSFTAPAELSKNLIDAGAVALEIYGKRADAVERVIDRHASKKAAEKRRAELGDKFRSMECPTCKALVD